MVRATRTVVLAAALGALSGAGCVRSAGRLLVEVESPVTAAPLVFHGNCFTGWLVSVSLRLRETEGVDVVLDRVSYRLTDEGMGRDLLTESLGGTEVEERAGSRMVPAHGEARFPITALSPEQPVGPVVLAGDVLGHDENGQAVVVPIRSTSPMSVAPPPVLGGGACGPGPD